MYELHYEEKSIIIINISEKCKICMYIFIYRKIREQKESERQARLRLSKRLEALRPSAAVSGKQDNAEATPVVFDIVSSSTHLSLIG